MPVPAGRFWAALRNPGNGAAETQFRATRNVSVFPRVAGDRCVMAALQFADCATVGSKS